MMHHSSSFIAATLEGHAVRIETLGDDLRLVRETPNEVRRVSADLSKIHVVTMVERPGATEWSHAVEQRMYPPLDPDKNERFSMRFVKWCELVWAVISVPRTDETTLRAMTSEMEMKIADGVPHMIGDGSVQIFPVHGPNVYTLEGYGGHDPNNPEG